MSAEQLGAHTTSHEGLQNRGGPSPRLRLRSIVELLKERFVVPTYQRGYRWSSRQVVALLDDLAGFVASAPSRDGYYCLQPIVVLRRDSGEWELVDGQQRLTTIFLVLRVLEDIAKLLGLSRFSIDYETRLGSAKFLEKPNLEDSEHTIDQHHMFEAFVAIEQWFSTRDGSFRLDLLRCITGPDGSGPNVRIVWYELEEDADPVKAFVRLNVGKIPLTSSELIRALLLRTDGRGADARDQVPIARDWDTVERRLQDDRFWYFLQSDGHATASRIEFLFDVFVRIHGAQDRPARNVDFHDPLATFLEFQVILDRDGSSVWSTWQSFKRLAQTLDDWFEDRSLYHLVGFLIATTPTDPAKPRSAAAALLLDLLRVRSTASATELDVHLRRLAFRRFMGSQAREAGREGVTTSTLDEHIAERLDRLTYGTPAPVRVALLLFNVAGILEQTASAQRFEFAHFKVARWDIEHVRSVAEYVPSTPSMRRGWLTHARDFTTSPSATALDADEAGSLRDAIDEILSAEAPDPARTADVFRRVRILGREPETRGEDDTISNLVLLDMGTNRSYRNAIFPVKRRRIIELDRDGQFVPPATRNVFLKYYSPDATQLLLWDDDDGRAYSQAVKSTLRRFFAPLVEGSV